MVKSRKRKKTLELYLRASKESIKNARSWLENANHLLYEKNEYGHSLSLVLFAIEETMKSWICFTVGIDTLDPNDEIVKEMFSSHPSKIETALLLWLFLNVPILQSTLRREYSDDEVGVLKDVITSLDDYYESSAVRLVKLRTKGMYVDILEGKISTPKEISKIEAERVYYDAFRLLQQIQLTLSNYEEADSKEKERRRLDMLRSTKFLQENFDKVTSMSPKKDESDNPKS